MGLLIFSFQQYVCVHSNYFLDFFRLVIRVTFVCCGRSHLEAAHTHVRAMLSSASDSHMHTHVCFVIFRGLAIDLCCSLSKLYIRSSTPTQTPTQTFYIFTDLNKHNIVQPRTNKQVGFHVLW